MNKPFFFARLAAQNLRKNGIFYLPFFLACAGCTGMVYIMRYLTYNKLLENIPGGGDLFMMLGLGSFIMVFTVFGILVYANNFVMKRRHRELALFNILGMEKRHLACILGFETLYLAAGSIVAGILGGALFSKLVLLGLLKLLRFSVPMGFSFSLRGAGETSGFIAAIFLFLYLSNLWHVRLASPIELLHSSSAGDREPKSHWIQAVLGMLCLGGGYAISLLTRDPIAALLLFFAAVALVILGTGLLFRAGSVVILKSMRRNKKFYYQPSHFTAISGMIYRMKQNARGLANICILSTMVLVAVATTVSLYTGSEEVLSVVFPNQIALQAVCSPDKAENADFTPLDTAVRQAAAKDGCPNEAMQSFLQLSFTASSTDGTNYNFDSNNFTDSLQYTVLEILTAEDYNRLSGSEIMLAPNEVLAYGDGGPDISIGGMSFTVKQTLDSFPVRCGDFNTNMAQSRYVVVADRTVLCELYRLQADAYGKKDRASSLVYELQLNPTGSPDSLLACFADTQDAANSVVSADGIYAEASVRASSRQENSDTYYSMYGGFLFLGLFLAVLFLLATVLIIYYKQLSEGYEDRDRFLILQKVGMSEAEVRKTIRTQVLMVFFLPLAVAGIHTAFALPILSRLLSLFSLKDIPLFILCTAVTFVVFSAVYVLVYSATAKHYYRIVKM
jgi:putative ABC transport system permease protein